jgi:3-deoxy-D-manno-octulosonate cytidylyltransferase
MLSAGAENCQPASNSFDMTVEHRLSCSPVTKFRPGLEEIPMMEAVGVIPSRYRSVRFPGKALAPLLGRPLVQHVFERAREARSLDRILVATDDERIRQAVTDFGGEAILTSPHHASGTDRVAEVAREIPAGIYVNIQGDEPLVDPRDIDRLVDALKREPGWEAATLRRQIRDEEDLENPHVVKVVNDRKGHALYFSRSRIPFGAEPGGTFRHVGLYAYRRDLLRDFAATPPGRLELAERLEQLRILEMGRGLAVLDAVGDSIGVDTPEDLERVHRIMRHSNHRST